MRSTAPRAPRTPRGIALCVVFAALAGFAPRAVRAEDAPHPGAEAQAPAASASGVVAIAVSYDLPPVCPSASDFERAVIERAPTARFTADATRRFHVAAWLDAGEWVGELGAVPAVDASSVRRVRGATCGDVVSALALITALALEPGSAGESTAGGAAAVPAPPAPTAPGATTAPPPVGPAPPVFVPPPPGPGDAAQTVGTRERSGSRWSFSIGADALAALGIAPLPLFGAGISFDASPARDQSLPWLVRLSVAEFVPREAGSPLKARFAGQFLALEGCPVGLRLGPAVRVLPCIGLEGGLLEVSGVPQAGLALTQEENALFWAAIQPLRVVVRLGKRFSLEADGTLKEPFRHDSFGYARPPVPVHTVPAVVGSLGLGLRADL